MTRRLGNDVVDLAAPDNRRSAANPRYARRVLCERERQCLARAAAPERLLWMFWSAKEAAYKVLSPDGRYGFSQREFEVSIEASPTIWPATGYIAGQVCFREHRVAVKWQWTADYVHCVGADELTAVQSAIGNVVDAAFDVPETVRARYASMPRASVAARLLAHDLLQQTCAPPDQLWISRKSRHAPQVVVGDAIWPQALLSLSHDGRFAAAALLMCP